MAAPAAGWWRATPSTRSGNGDDPWRGWSRPRALSASYWRGEASRFVWRTFADPEELVAARLAAAERFLADLERRRDEGRYLPHALPALPFPDGSFDLALCSHFLFLYSAALNSAFHHTALGELLRVAREVRVFPLLTMDGAASPHLASVTAWLRRAGHGVTIRRVDYEVMRGGDRMLLMRRGA